MSGIYNLYLQPILAATILAGAIAVLSMYLFRKRKRTSIPTEWCPVGKVKTLCMYPLKSGRRIELKTAFCTEYGIQLKLENGYPLKDRCLVVYKESNKETKTARTYPKMVLIHVTTESSNNITLNAPNMETLQVDVSNFDQTTDGVMIEIDEKVFTIDCGDEAAQWVSRYILEKTSGLRLGLHDGLPNHRRTINQQNPALKFYPNLESSSMGLYSDLSSYLLINKSSVDELSARILKSNTISVHNFRPNIIVEGDDLKPYDEDGWDWIKIGDVILRNVKPCVRCILTTIDPETGIRATNGEPLKTLKSYRKVKALRKIDYEGDDPVMGIYLGLKRSGEIKVGDAVFIGKN